MIRVNVGGVRRRFRLWRLAVFAVWFWWPLLVFEGFGFAQRWWVYVPVGLGWFLVVECLFPTFGVRGLLASVLGAWRGVRVGYRARREIRRQAGRGSEDA